MIPNTCFSSDLGGVSFSAPETVDPVMRAIRRIPQSSDPGVVPRLFNFQSSTEQLVYRSINLLNRLMNGVVIERNLYNAIH